jgi:hypothetical protein
MLIFVSGQYPILGTQLLYFSDPVLSRRAQIPPPTDLRSLRAVRDAMEHQPDNEMERAFIEELEQTTDMIFDGPDLQDVDTGPPGPAR